MAFVTNMRYGKTPEILIGGKEKYFHKIEVPGPLLQLDHLDDGFCNAALCPAWHLHVDVRVNSAPECFPGQNKWASK